MTTQFWLDNPNELVRTIEIWPTEDMTTIEKYNAITRLMLILTTTFFSKWKIFFQILSQKKNLIALFFSGLLIFINWQYGYML